MTKAVSANNSVPGTDQTQRRGADSSQSQKSSWLSSERVFQLLLAYRLVNALTVRTFFQPDEYYQALEPAWTSAFGPTGHAWITWEWHQHIRSSLHPALFALAYRAADIVAVYGNLTPSSRADLLLAAPKILQAVIAAAGDYFTWRLAQRIYGAASDQASTALTLTVANPWQWFCSTRTFSNGLETSLTIAALYKWPFTFNGLSSQRRDTSTTAELSHVKDGQRLDVEDPSVSPGWALLLAAFATLLRPTNIIVWATLTIYALTLRQAVGSSGKPPSESKNPPTGMAQADLSRASAASPTFADVRIFLQYAVSCGLLALLISVALDYYFFGQLTFPPLNFLVFNIIKSLSIFYGNNDWHYYLSQGYPLLLTTALPFTLIAIYQALRGSASFQRRSRSSRIALRGLVSISIGLPAFLSILSHKEVRFIYPLLPAFHILAADPVWHFFGPVLPGGKRTQRSDLSSKLLRRIVLATLLALNATIAIYTSQIHNSGLVSLPAYLRKEYENHYSIDDEQQSSTANRSMTVAFLMPCHSVPWRSHLQYPPSSQQPGIKAWALTCEPPLHIDDSALKAKYRDEADHFYDDPSLWIRQNMARSTPEGIIDNRGTKARREAGVYAEIPVQDRKKLWRKRSDLDDRGIDIIDLLPYLSTWQPPTLPAPLPPPSSSEKSLEGGTTTAGEQVHNPSQSPRLQRLQEASLQGKSPSSAHHIRRPWPHYLAFFAQIEATMQAALRQSNYRECHRIFNSHWHDDWRRTGDIIIWCLRPLDPNDNAHPRHANPVSKSSDPVRQNKKDRGSSGGSSSSEKPTRDATKHDHDDVDVVPKQRPSQRGIFIDQRPIRGRDRKSSGQQALHILNRERV